MPVVSFASSGHPEQLHISNVSTVAGTVVAVCGADCGTLARHNNPRR